MHGWSLRSASRAAARRNASLDWTRQAKKGSPFGLPLGEFRVWFIGGRMSLHRYVPHPLQRQARRCNDSEEKAQVLNHLRVVMN
jgi:hypothetical protein